MELKLGIKVDENESITTLKIATIKIETDLVKN